MCSSFVCLVLLVLPVFECFMAGMAAVWQLFAGVLAALSDGIMTNSGNEGADYVCTLPEATDGLQR